VENITEERTVNVDGTEMAISGFFVKEKLSKREQRKLEKIEMANEKKMIK